MFEEGNRNIINYSESLPRWGCKLKIAYYPNEGIILLREKKANYD